MKEDYEKLWSQLVGFINEGDGKRAREIWDSVVEDAWKYRDLSS